MRLFVAVDVPRKIQAYLASLKSSFFFPKARLSWVKSENVHVTLKFLGEVEESKVDSIGERLDQIRFKGFHLVLNRLGCFPSEQKMRVFWANFVDSSSLVELSRQVSEQLSEFKNDHPFSDHMTLARIKCLSPSDKDKFVRRMRVFSLSREKFSVGDFVLYRSVLSTQGSVYSEIRRFSLQE